MADLKEKDPGTPAKVVCSECNAPWGKGDKCLLCQGSSPVDLSAHRLSVIEVDGLSWQLRLTEAGPTWVPSDTKVTKAAGFVEVGDMGRPPPSAASGASKELVSFSEQVLADQRLTLQEQVTQFGQDEIFHPERHRPPTMEDKDNSQTAVIFHPKTIQMMRFKAELLATPDEDLEAASEEAKKRKTELKKKQEAEMMEGELDNLIALQQGAHMVPQPAGAAVLRHLDLQQFRSYLKRKHEESGATASYEALMAAQTSQQKAAAANQALDSEFRGRRMALKPIEVASFSLWTPELQTAWQGNIFAPSTDAHGPEQLDMEALKQPYLRMKELIKDNKPTLSKARATVISLGFCFGLDPGSAAGTKPDGTEPDSGLAQDAAIPSSGLCSNPNAAITFSISWSCTSNVSLVHEGSNSISGAESTCSVTVSVSSSIMRSLPGSTSDPITVKDPIVPVSLATGLEAIGQRRSETGIFTSSGLR